jgi:hypothetical protein
VSSQDEKTSGISPLRPFRRQPAEADMRSAEQRLAGERGQQRAGGPQAPGGSRPQVPASPGSQAPSGDGRQPSGSATAPPVVEGIRVDLRRPKTSRLRIGDILKEMGLATDAQIEAALAKQRETKQRLGQVLVEMGVVTQLALTRALSAKSYRCVSSTMARCSSRWPTQPTCSRSTTCAS